MIRLNSLPVVAVLALAAGLVFAETPLLPGGKWHVHDMNRPVPEVVQPGSCSTQNDPGQPPFDAIVLFDGSDLSQWVQHYTVEENGEKRSKVRDPIWKLEDGAVQVVGGTGDITSRESFGSCQLHLEWCAPDPQGKQGQKRGNSGVFLMGLYEVQVLDSYENRTYADGQAAAVYGQTPPLVNACRKPGEWQSYDIVFTAPRFKDGELLAPAYVTVLHNGVLVQNHTAFQGPTVWKKLAKYRPHEPKLPLRIQNHGDPVKYRNIWIRPLD